MARTSGSRGIRTEHNRKSILEEIRLKGKRTPLEFMLYVMWNTRKSLQIRLDAAKAAAPYVHRKQPLDLIHSGELEVIPPYLPTRRK